MPLDSPTFRRLTTMLASAEEAYTLASYAEVLAFLETLPFDEPLVVFARGSVAHALAEMRGSVSLMDEAKAYYLRAAPGLPRPPSRMIPELVAECDEQLREAGLRR